MSNCLYPRAPLSLVLALPSLNHSQLFSLPLLLTLCNLPCCTYGFTAAVSDLSSLFATPFPATTLLYCPFHQLHSREGVPRPTENTVKLLSQPAHFSRLDLHISHLVQTRITSSAHSFKSGYCTHKYLSLERCNRRVPRTQVCHSSFSQFPIPSQFVDHFFTRNISNYRLSDSVSPALSNRDSLGTSQLERCTVRSGFPLSQNGQLSSFHRQCTIPFLSLLHSLLLLCDLAVYPSLPCSARFLSPKVHYFFFSDCFPSCSLSLNVQH